MFSRGGLLTSRMRNIWSLIFYLGRAQPPLSTVLLFLSRSIGPQGTNSNRLPWGPICLLPRCDSPLSLPLNCFFLFQQRNVFLDPCLHRKRGTSRQLRGTADFSYTLPALFIQVPSPPTPPRPSRRHWKFLFIYFSTKVQLIDNVMLVSGVQQDDSLIHVYILFHILFHYSLLQDIEYNSLCYTVGPCCLCVLCILAFIC